LGFSAQEAAEMRAQIEELYSTGRLAEDYIAGVSPPVTYFAPGDIDSADDGLAMFREVASDDAIALPRSIAHGHFTFVGSSARGTDGRDLFYFEEGDRTLQVTGLDGDDVYVIRHLSAALTGGDPRIVEGDNGGNDTAWVSVNDYILSNGVENLVSMTENGVRMLANDGNNKFIGGPGDDQLFSGFGEDIVYGREGNDLIVGGDETDALFGAAGDDIFAWELSHVGDDDRIWDWNVGDRLDLRGLGGVLVTQNGADTQVWYDPNRDGVAEAHVVTIVGVVDRDLIEAAITL
jgi:Ca2+-binding RTX toxin-like protein